MIQDLQTIKRLGEQNLKSNYRFRSFLKNKDLQGWIEQLMSSLNYILQRLIVPHVETVA